MFSVTAEKCSQSRLWARLEANSRRLIQRERACCSLIARYIQLTTVCWTQSLTISDTAVCQVLWRLVVQTPMPSDGLWWRPWTRLDLPHRANASQYVAAATVHGRTGAFHWREVREVREVYESRRRVVPLSATCLLRTKSVLLATNMTVVDEYFSLRWRLLSILTT